MPVCAGAPKYSSLTSTFQVYVIAVQSRKEFLFFPLLHEKNDKIVDIKIPYRNFATFPKGQLNSKCPYEKSVLSKIPKKKFPGFQP